MRIIPSVQTDNIIYKWDDQLYFNPELKTKYYNYYYSYGLHYKPRNIFEIGVRAGYTGYFLALGSKAQKFRGIDLETYRSNSTSHAVNLIKSICHDCEVQIGDSHQLSKLDELYDLIHIDGDHSYHGKVLDLELALANLAPKGVIIVDDYNPNLGIEVKSATDHFVTKHQLKIDTYSTFTGHAVVYR